MSQKKKKFLVGLMCLFVGVLLVLVVMKRQGFFRDPAVALRELKKAEIEASAERARQAVREGDVELLTVLGRAGMDLTELDGGGKNALHLALEGGQAGMLPVFKEHGMDVDLADGAGRVPLWYALEKDTDGMARWMAAEGAKVDFKAGEEAAFLSYYDAGRWDDVTFLVENKADVEVVDAKGEGLLARAVAADDPVRLRQFLGAGANANVKFTDGEAVVSRGLRMGKVGLVMPLLSAGADANGKTPNGESLMHRVVRDRKLLGLNDEVSTEIVATLIEKGAEFEVPDQRGDRPIQVALRTGFTGGVELLMPRIKDVSGCVEIAVDRGDWVAMSALLKKGADANTRIGNEPVLFTMIKQGQVKMVNELLDHGAEIEALGGEGQRPLVTAIAAKQHEVVMALLSHERKPDLSAHMEFPMTEDYRKLFGKSGLFDWYCRNEREIQPIMASVMLGDLPAVQRFLELGVDRYSRTKNKVYPIQMAASRGDVPMQQVLIGVPHEDEKQARSFIVDISEQKVHYMKGGKVVKSVRCSTGMKGYRTPPGKYVITDRTKDKISNLYRDAKMPYFQRFSCSEIGFHEGYVGRSYASHGCIRLSMSSAKYFWGQAKIGDRVTIRK